MRPTVQGRVDKFRAGMEPSLRYFSAEQQVPENVWTFIVCSMDNPPRIMANVVMRGLRIEGTIEDGNTVQLFDEPQKGELLHADQIFNVTLDVMVRTVNPTFFERYFGVRDKHKSKHVFTILGVLIIAALVFLALPRINPRSLSRESSDRTAEMNNVKGLVAGMLAYETANGKLPEDPAQVVVSLGTGGGKMLKSPRSPTPPLQLTNEQEAAARKDWHAVANIVEDHCDFTFVSGGIKLGTIRTPSSFILVFPKKAVPASDGSSVGFADGHVQWASPADIRRLAEENNVVRKTLNLPLMTVDETGHIVLAFISLREKERVK